MAEMYITYLVQDNGIQLQKLRSRRNIEVYFWPLGSVWMEEWKSGRMENCGRMEMWEDGKYLVFPLVCLVRGVEKWEGGKLFCLVGEKNGRMKNVIYIN